MKKYLSIASAGVTLLFYVSFMPSFAYAQVGTFINHTEVESSAMTTITGQCSPGITATQVIFYCNDSGRYHQNNGFTSLPGKYRIDIHGSSTNSSLAGIAVIVGGKPVGVVTWNSTTPTTQSLTFDIVNGTTTQEVKLLLTTDNGSSDTMVDWYDL